MKNTISLDKVTSIKYHLYQVLILSSIVLTACTSKTPTSPPRPPASPSTVGGVPIVVTPSSSPSVGATPSSSDAYQVIDELHKPQFTAQSKNIFKTAQLPNTKVQFDPLKLLAVLASTRQYFQNQSTSDPDIQRVGILAAEGVTIPKVLETLDFMIDTVQSDLEKKQPIRLQDPKFINDNFRAIEWTPFNPEKKAEKRLRITKYAVFTHPGSHTRTAEFNAGIYALTPKAESEQLRFKYSKQDALSNIYEPGGKEQGKVEPLAYLSRGGLESALMEGTILIKFTDGTSEFFNVDKNNEVAYVKGVDPSKQKRYWYFKKVNSIKGYGRTIETKISIEPGVTFAGDVLNIGLGKMVVLEQSIGGKQHLQMGVIADTGGAFLPNLHQLDFLAGVFGNNTEYVSQVKELPDYAKAYILVKR
jgi:hypothetical protein